MAAAGERPRAGVSAPARLTAAGHSMRPFVLAGATLRLAPVRRSALRPGALVAYRAQDQLVLHRLVRAEGDVFWARGDAHARVEGPYPIDRLVGICPDLVLGRLSVSAPNGLRRVVERGALLAAPWTRRARRPRRIPRGDRVPGELRLATGRDLGGILRARRARGQSSSLEALEDEFDAGSVVLARHAGRLVGVAVFIHAVSQARGASRSGTRGEGVARLRRFWLAPGFDRAATLARAGRLATAEPIVVGPDLAAHLGPQLLEQAGYHRDAEGGFALSPFRDGPRPRT